MSDFQPVDTTNVQINSMVLFMRSLTYHFRDGGWVTDAPALQHIRRLSQRTAIALHNLPAEKWVEIADGRFAPVIHGKMLDLAADAYTLAQSTATKLVKKVKMQPSRTADEGAEIQHYSVRPMQPYMTRFLGLTD